MPAKGIIEGRPNVPFDIMVGNLTNIPAYVPKHIVLIASNDSMCNIIDLEEVDKRRRHTVATVQTASKPPVQKLELVKRSDTNEHGRNTINMPPEYTSYRTWLIKMLE